MNKHEYRAARVIEIADQIQVLSVVQIAEMIVGLELQLIEQRDAARRLLGVPGDDPAVTAAADRVVARVAESQGFDLFEGRELPVVPGGYGTIPNPGGRRAGQDE